MRRGLMLNGFRFFSRNYHVAKQNAYIDIMIRYMHRPEFIEAKAKNHIDFYNMKDIDSTVLQETLEILFSDYNAKKTIEALNKGDLCFKSLMIANAQKRQLYLQEFSKNNSPKNWHEFAVEQESMDWNSILERYGYAR